MAKSYDVWLGEVRAALHSINMPMDDWQGRWPFDFAHEHRTGVSPSAAAESANRFWWREQNRALRQECRKTPGCWLPRDHQSECQPV